jgi:hypothetical protein
MNFKCFLGFHKYKFIKINHYYDTSYGGNAQSTGCIYKCSCCHNIKSKDYYNVGFLTWEDLKDE